MNEVILSKVIELISGGTPKTSVKEYWENGTIGWLSVNDFNNDYRKVYKSEKKITELGVKNSSTKILEKDDIIISARGTVGVLAQIGTPMAFNQSCFGIRGKKGIIDNTYLYYCLKNYVNNIIRRSQGSVFNTINLASFDLMKINIHPNIQTQKSIASILSALDDKIELNNQINAELEAMAKTLYDYWFVQFDFPFDPSTSSGLRAQGSATDSGIEPAGTDTEPVEVPYKSSGGKMVFNKKLKREIPEGWEVKRIQEIAKTGSGGTPKSTKKEYYESGSIPWINSGELNNPFIVNTSNFITKMGMKNSSAKLFPKNTILMAMYGATAGKTSIVSFEVTTNQAICAIIPKKGILLYYLKYSLDHLYNYLVNLSSGSARDNLSQNKIQKLEIIIPSEKILSTFSEEIKPFFEKIENNLKQNQELAALRDWLLPMLMNGQVTSPLRQAQGSTTEIGDKDYKTGTTYAQAAEEREKYGE